MKKLLPVIAVALATLFAAGAQAQTLDKIKKDGAITIGHRDASIPFSYFVIYPQLFVELSQL